MFGRQSGDPQTDLACQIRFLNTQLWGQLLKDGEQRAGSSFSAHSAKQKPEEQLLVAGMQLTSHPTRGLNRSSATAQHHFSSSHVLSVSHRLLSGWEGGRRGKREKRKESETSAVVRCMRVAGYSIYTGVFFGS